MGGPRLVRLSRHLRPTALVSAVATLLGALFLCLGVSDPAGHREPRPAAQTVTRTHAPAGAQALDDEQYACPYERGGCSLFPALSPAVLSAPPLDPPLHADGRAARPAEALGDGRPPHPGARPRAPDLHVLQVLRT
ncbi:hypothetical protein [Streptomyces sp. NPDC051909]|uniref:hypothetical protein n=1 Tax=Streptomyces sp. NPDC051909 TaxID=3154944 RepID=UPI00343114F7